MAQEIAVAAEVVKEATSVIYGLLKRQISYVFQYQDHVNDLKNLIQEIIDKRERVQTSVERAEREGEEIYELVTKWLSVVDDFTEGVAKSIIEDEDKANKSSCFKLGSCPNLIQRYRLGQKAMKATRDGADLLGKGIFSYVSYGPALQRIESSYGGGYEASDFRMQVLLEIMDTLMDANVNMIGVYGMGGVGKTTLVKKVAWLAKQNKLYDEVAVANVAQTPNYKKIQEKIAFDLGLEFGQESEYKRAVLLRVRIKMKNVLIILDDIWTKLDLDAIGIPFGGAEEQGKDDKVRRCTVLLTSRNLYVLHKDMKTQKNFSVDPLSDGDALNLFRNIVGDYVESPDFHPVAVEIVAQCAGLPMAVSSIAFALKNQSLDFWKAALVRLKRSPNMDETLHSSIELSYHFLKNEEAKTLFLLCALENAGSNVFIGDLLKYSMGLSLFGDVCTLEEGRNRLATLIDHLKASCLLLDGDVDGTIKMHDIIHAVATSIASTYKFMFNIQNAIGLKEVLEKIKDSIAISLSFGDIYDELPQKLECPKLKLFLLLMKNQNLQIPDTFFEEMRELKVLDLTGIKFLSLPSSLYCLKNIRTLCLDRCLLGDVAIVGNLKTLEILSFLDSNIEQLPGEIRQLTRLKLLDLTNCLNLRYIAPNVISCLSQLEELYMGNSFAQWEVERVDNQGRRNASLEELKRLSNLTTLHLHIQDAQVMPRDLLFKKLKNYKIFIGDKWKWSSKYDLSASRMFKLKINNSIYLGPGIKTLLKMTEDLSLEGMNGVRNVLYELDMEGFPHLKHLLVKDSLELLYIIKSVAWKLAFLELESLILSNLINLEKICHGQLNAGSFRKLRIMKIGKCDRLLYLFASSVAKDLTQLQEIEVTDCKNLKEIFGEERKDHGDEIETNSEIETNIKIEFNQLCSLTLQRLPQFMKKCFDVRVVFPRLENLKLCSINIENTWLDQPLAMSSYGQCLKTLTVEECNGLKFLFSSSMVKSLKQLHKLVVGNCMSMEVIVDSQGEEGEEKINDTSFPKLFYLKLEVLPKLVSFGRGNSIKFPSLNELHIDSCSNLKTFFCKSFYSDRVREEPGEQVNLESYFIDINPLFDGKVAFPRLEVMELLHLDNLQLIWHNQQLHVESYCKLKEVRVEFYEQLNTIVLSNSHGLLTLHNLKKDISLDFKYEAFQDYNSTKICYTQHPTPFYQKLTHLILWGYGKIKYVFPSFIAKSLHQLQQLKIGDCKALKEIIAREGANEEVDFVFPHVTLLKLEDLPKLTTFCPEVHTSKWPMLKELVVINCDKFTSKHMSFQENSEEGELNISDPKSIFLDNEINSDLHKMELKDKNRVIQWQSQSKVLKIWDDVSANIPFQLLQRFKNLKELQLFLCDQYKEIKCLSVLPNLKVLNVSCCYSLMSLVSYSASFQNLKVLNVSVCNKLMTRLIKPSMAKCLVQLREMSICDCGMVTEIVGNEGNATSEIVFNKLKKLSLTYLESLTCFCSGNYSFNFPSLEDLIIWNCSNMKTFSKGILSAPKLHKFDYERKEKDLVNGGSELNTTIQQAHKKKVDSSLKELTLTLSGRDIKSIWQPEFQENSTVQNLDILEVQYGDNLTTLLPSLASFENLRTLRVRYCNGLQKLMSFSTAKSLVQLEFLLIGGCEKMTEVLGNEGDIEKGEIVFEKLKELYLYNLESLTCFCSGEYTLNFPFLERLYVSVCSKMKIFSGRGLSMPRLQELNWRDCSKSDFYTITQQSQNDCSEFCERFLNRLPLTYDEEELD